MKILITGGAGFVASNLVVKLKQQNPEYTLYVTGKKVNVSYSDSNRIGYHIWRVSDVSKFKRHYPNWHWKYNLETTMTEISTALTNHVR